MTGTEKSSRGLAPDRRHTGNRPVNSRNSCLRGTLATVAGCRRATHAAFAARAVSTGRLASRSTGSIAAAAFSRRRFRKQVDRPTSARAEPPWGRRFVSLSWCDNTRSCAEFPSFDRQVIELWLAADTTMPPSAWTAALSIQRLAAKGLIPGSRCRRRARLPRGPGCAGFGDRTCRGARAHDGGVDLADDAALDRLVLVDRDVADAGAADVDIVELAAETAARAPARRDRRRYRC